jgi:hypothetical protein
MPAIVAGALFGAQGCHDNFVGTPPVEPGSDARTYLNVDKATTGQPGIVLSSTLAVLDDSVFRELPIPGDSVALCAPPLGGRMVIYQGGRSDQDAKLVVTDLEGEHGVVLASTSPSSPLWGVGQVCLTAGGERVVFARNRQVVAANSDGVWRREVDLGEDVYSLACSPDGRSAICAIKSGVAIVNITTGAVRAIFSYTGSQGLSRMCDWSPSGDRVVFDSCGVLLVADPAGNILSRMSMGTWDAWSRSSVVWLPDGARLAYLAYDGTESAIRVSDARGNVERSIDVPQFRYPWQVSSDGARMLCVDWRDWKAFDYALTTGDPAEPVSIDAAGHYANGTQATISRAFWPR